jgi:hypothetical protein
MSKIELMRTFAKGDSRGGAVASSSWLDHFKGGHPMRGLYPMGWTATINVFHWPNPQASVAGCKQGSGDSSLHIPLIVPEFDGEDRIGRRAAMSIQHAAPMSERFVESTLPCGLQP